MLSVFRDGTLHGQAELTVQGLRIGRGSENDIVLEDAAKRVSRLHAELRLEADGAITLTDLQSANGTWIAGDRVENEPIEPGVPFTIGPYRLMLEELADAGAVDYPSDSLPAAPSIAQPPESVAQAPAPSGVKRKGDTTKTQGWKAAAGVMDLALRHRWAAIIGGGAVVGLAGLGIYAISKPDAPPVVDSLVTPTTPPAETPTPVPQPEDPHAAHLNEADRLLVQGDKASAEVALRDHISPVLQQDPTHARALDLKIVAERIITPVTPVTQPTIPTPRQLNVNPVDPRAQHQLRLGEARVALERNDYRSALTSIESLINDAPDYTEATALRQKILSERLEAARRQVAEAEELVKNGRLPEAIDAIRRAAATDPSVSVAPRINEIRAKMEQEGQEAFENGMNYSQATRPDQAIPLLQKAWRYLPDGHRDKPKARAELERLGAPVR
jgi:hypothetical protein